MVYNFKWKTSVCIVYLTMPWRQIDGGAKEMRWCQLQANEKVQMKKRREKKTQKLFTR